jgi:hypothetical protein
MSLIIRNLNCIRASGSQTLVETTRGADTEGQNQHY